LRKNLKQKWRNALNKSEKQGLTIDIDQDGKSLDILLKRYMSDRLQKKYAGASPKMIKSLAKHAAPRGELLILNAIKDQDIIASILVFLHGTSATYQIGWSGQKGRVHNAHYALLWQAICILKQNNITDFDLGGINDDSAAGVKAFKNGLGGQEIALIGQYS
jgi:lipid II:glycine glycyltransferase (peptidoglycan interpeptide bridge formation enzyme)